MRQCLLRSPEAVAYCDRSFLLVVGRSSYGWSYAWSRDQQRLEKFDGKIHHIVGNRTTSGSHKRSIVAPDDRSFDQSWNSATETSPHFIMSVTVSNRLVVPPVVRLYHSVLPRFSKGQGAI